MSLNLFLKNIAVISSFIIYAQKSRFRRTGKTCQEKKKKKRKKKKNIISYASKSNEKGSVTGL